MKNRRQREEELWNIIQAAIKTFDEATAPAWEVKQKAIHKANLAYEKAIREAQRVFDEATKEDRALKDSIIDEARNRLT